MKNGVKNERGKKIVQLEMVRICQAGCLIQSPYCDDIVVAIGKKKTPYMQKENKFNKTYQPIKLYPHES